MKLFILITLNFFITTLLFADHDQQVEAITPLLITADKTEGKTLFLQCRTCHAANKSGQHKIGPNLWNIINRPMGQAAGYPYSEAMKAGKYRWDYETLNHYLWNPKKMVPKGNMEFLGIPDTLKRAQLIAYLRTLSDAPVALPKDQQFAYGGLPEGPGREAVYYTCRACHSLQQFDQQRLNRQQWNKTIHTMIDKNGMAAPERWVRTRILNYLATHFGKEEDWQGLPPGIGRKELYYSCQACHSLKTITQQGLSKEDWDETLTWMVEEQEMDPLPSKNRQLILNYLALHFGRDK